MWDSNSDLLYHTLLIRPTRQAIVGAHLIYLPIHLINHLLITAVVCNYPFHQPDLNFSIHLIWHHNHIIQLFVHGKVNLASQFTLSVLIWSPSDSPCYYYNIKLNAYNIILQHNSIGEQLLF